MTRTVTKDIYISKFSYRVSLVRMPVELQILGRAVKAAQYRQHRALDSRLASVGSTLAQWDALRAIGRTPGASARELAAATFQSEQAFGTLAGRLVGQGLVDRRPGHGPRRRRWTRR
jgi:DNA-binding MarR family transcriptional regulator